MEGVEGIEGAAILGKSMRVRACVRAAAAAAADVSFDLISSVSCNAMQCSAVQASMHGHVYGLK